MIEEHAQVVAIDKDSAWVQVQRQSTCGQCQANKVCGTSVLNKVYGRKSTMIKVLNPLQAQVGETVILAIPEDALVKSALVAYGFPLLGLLLLSGLMQAAGLTEGLVILSALCGLVLGAGAAWVLGQRVRLAPRYQPTIVRRLLASRLETSLAVAVD